MRRHALACGLALCLPASAALAEFDLALGEIGQREYYCTAEMTLTNTGPDPVMEVSGHFFLYVGADRVGRSKGTWFMNIAPGASVTTVFETPNAPCTDVDRYEFVVGACRMAGPGFDPVDACSTRINGTGPVEVAPGS
ncbi:hypothetical protein [Dinoroseobacter sp. S124A]|uniref:hypothetical protein n=1 Tax=Dinoroseobacter sp. S124A TaxID=3415128 RepID=UPI003C7E4064